MKIALCFYGQSRFVKEGYLFHKGSLLDGHDVDTFVHTWNDPDKTGLPYPSALGENYDIQSADVISTIVNLYKPKKLLCEIPKNFEIYKNCKFNKSQPNGMYSMFYSKYVTNKLKSEYENENKFKYDVVFYSRFDFALNRKFDFSVLDLSKVHIPDFDYFNDQCGFGSSQIIDLASEVYENISKHCDDGVVLGGEDLLKKQINEHSLKIDFFHPFGPNRYNSTRNSLIRELSMVKQ